MNDILILNISLIEWIGYVASTLVLISLSLSSIIKLRVFNLFGAAVFSFYGFFIGSLPVGLMNLIIVFANLYYLQSLYFHKDDFEIIETDSNQEYVNKFIQYYNSDIRKYFPDYEFDRGENQLVLMVMRNMNLAGIFIAEKEGSSLNIELDYVTPQYRDYKNGAFVFSHFRKALENKRYTNIYAKTENKQQIKYLEKMGFKSSKSVDNTNRFVLNV